MYRLFWLPIQQTVVEHAMAMPGRGERMSAYADEITRTRGSDGTDEEWLDVADGSKVCFRILADIPLSITIRWFYVETKRAERRSPGRGYQHDVQ